MLKHKEDRLNAIRGFTAPILFLLPFYFPLPSQVEWIAILVLWLILSDINHILHLHIHHPFFNNRLLNLMLDVCMGFVTGMTASNWRIQHVHGHHGGHRNDRGLGVARELKEFSICGALAYSMRTSWHIFVWPLTESYKKGVLSNIDRPVHYRWAFIEQCGILVITMILLLHFPVLTVSYVIPWYILVYFVSRYTDYLNHFGVTTNGSFVTNSCVNHFYNRVRCNFGYHAAHHYNPKAHWTELPLIHNSIAHRIPENHIKNYSWSGLLMPYHFYLSLRGKM